jgi:hypothetical protein
MCANQTISYFLTSKRRIARHAPGLPEASLAKARSHIATVGPRRPVRGGLTPGSVPPRAGIKSLGVALG